MKVSKRDLMLLLVVLVLGIGLLLGKYLFQPIIEDINYAEEELSGCELRRDAYNATAGRLDELAARRTELEGEATDAVSRFLPDAVKSKIVEFVTVTTSAGPAVDSLAFSEDTILATAAETNEIAASADTMDYLLGTIAAEVRRSGGLDADTGDGSYVPSYGTTDTELYCTRVQLAFKGISYSAYMGFTDRVEAYDRTIVPQSVNFAQNGEGGLDVTVVYAFYSLTKINDLDAGLPAATAPASVGRADPFAG